MKTYKLAAMLLGAALLTGIGATSAFAKCDGEGKMAPETSKCSGEKKEKMNAKCSGEKKEKMEKKDDGKAKSDMKGKCGQGKCGS